MLFFRVSKGERRKVGRKGLKILIADKKLFGGDNGR